MVALSSIPIPTIPIVAVRLLELYEDPDFAVKEVTDLLRNDPALTAKIIRAANSSAYGIGREVSDLRQAVSLLGKAIVTPLALSFSLADQSMPSQAAAGLYRECWLQATVQAAAAECLAKKYAKSQVGEWFVAGLLSSIGRLALVTHDPVRYAQVMAHAKEYRIQLHDAEKELLDTTTVELSADLLREWSLPQRWVDATLQQVTLFDEFDDASKPPVPHQPLYVGVAVAGAVGSYFCRNGQGEAFIRVVHLMEEGFGASEDEVEDMLERIRQRLDAVSPLFNVRSANVKSSMELMAIAMQHLVRLAVENATQNSNGDSAAPNDVEQRNSLLQRIDRLTQRASTDCLTGVFNRGYFDDRFAEQIRTIAEDACGIGLIFIDIDHFKSINDTHGHVAGDEVLRDVARILKQAVRPDDVVARYGGEEFVVMLTNCSLGDLRQLSERVRAETEKMRIGCDDTLISVTISVGAAIGHPDEVTGRFGERLISAADRAMYKAKQGGRNRVVISDALSDTRQIPIPVAVPSNAGDSAFESSLPQPVCFTNHEPSLETGSV